MLLLVSGTPAVAVHHPVAAGDLERTELGPPQRERVGRIGPAPPAPEMDAVRADLDAINFRDGLKGK